MADAQANSAPAQQRPAAAQPGANETQSAPLDPPIVLQLNDSPPRFAPVNTRDQVSLGPLTDSALSEEVATLLAARTRDLLSSQTASLTNQPSQTILSLFPN
ncbi:hypothetical protein DWE98_08055 [Bosea caraganae]|uniref:Uncharacterized protein n=1 Tax=Bosea caraganae TaxID=2763117 RepID=A0A370L942_9HYPH|nr:hypothetical protein DWE98_08055 [Bosea caraganae]